MRCPTSVRSPSPRMAAPSSKSAKRFGRKFGDGEDYRERLIEEIERHAAIHRQEREAALRRSMDEDTWDPGPMPQLLPPVRAPRPEARESEPPVIEAGPQPWPE